MKLYHVTNKPIVHIDLRMSMFTWADKDMALAGRTSWFCSGDFIYEVEVADDTVVLSGIPGMYSSKGDHFWKEVFACESRQAWKYEDFVEVLIEGADIVRFHLMQNVSK